MDIKDIKDLITIVNNTNIETVEIKKKDFSIMITKGKHAGISATNYESQAKQVSNTTIEDVYDVEEITITENLYTVKSPMVGTFYRAPSPDSPPFVKIGDKVQKGQTLCIIEAMKIMNEIESEISGEIVDILLNDEDTVEYGQALMKIRR